MKKSFAAIILVGCLVPALSLAAVTTDRSGQACGAASDALCNPVSGVTNVADFIAKAMSFVGDLIGLIALATIIYAGFRMITANGNDKTITEAKGTIRYGLIGFGLSIMAYAFVLAVESFIGVKTTKPYTVNTIFNPFGNLTLRQFVENILKNVIEISGLVALLMLIWYGLKYIRARGNDKMVDEAKKGIFWSLAGIVTILMSYVLISAVANALGK